jgi:hypothetical protein
LSEPCKYIVFSSTLTLTELRLEGVDNVSDVAFVRHLPNLHTLELSFNEEEADSKLVLPPSIRELQCLSDYGWQTEFEFDGIEFEFAAPGGLRTVALSVVNLGLCQEAGLLGGVRSLASNLEASDTAQILANLIGGLTELRSLQLTKLGGPRSIALSSFVSGGAGFPVTSLELRNIDDDDNLAWLELVFPELTELKVRRNSAHGPNDRAVVQVFRTCPKLTSLVDTSTNGREDLVVTVGKRSDGRLVKRLRDISVVLDPLFPDQQVAAVVGGHKPLVGQHC